MDERDYPDDWHHRRRRVYRRDDFRCQNCGATGGPRGDTELHAHHVVPKSEGGSDALDNLTTLCYECHDAVHDHHVPRQSDDELEPSSSELASFGETSSASPCVGDEVDEEAEASPRTPASVVYDFDVDDPDAVRAAYVDDEIDEDEMDELLDNAIDGARDESASARDESASARDGGGAEQGDLLADRSPGEIAVAFAAAMAVTVGSLATAPLIGGGALTALALVTVGAAVTALVTGIGLLNHVVAAVSTSRA